MLFITLISIIIALVVGWVLKWFLDNQAYPDRTITWLEYGITSAVIALVLAPLTSWVGIKIAVKERTVFHEYRNGWEQAAVIQEITCSRDGPCYWTYSCDPYEVCHEVCTGSGKDEECHEECHTEYHSCPYCTNEYNYDVYTTLGAKRIAAYRFPHSPNAHQWREGIVVPSSIMDEAGVGEPQFWLDAKARIDSGLPGPVTEKDNYENYILRADYSILRDFSDKITFFKSRKLLPPADSAIYDYYWASKIQFVNTQVDNQGLWRRQLEYLNAELGRRLQGDLHVVVVSGAGDPDGYIMALKSSWQNPDTNGRNTASKNTVLVAIGTEDGKTVAWARAITGMPMGNELLITRIRNDFKGMPLDPDSVLGRTVAHLSNNRIDSVSVQGGLAEFLLTSVPFSRVSMSNYAYLRKEIHPSRTGYIIITILDVLLCCLAWIPSIVYGETWDN